MKFFFRMTVAGINESLALGFLYSTADNDLKQHSHGALNVFKHEDSLVVIKVTTILSVVAMVPFKQNNGDRRFFLVEKFALGVISPDEIM